MKNSHTTPRSFVARLKVAAAAKHLRQTDIARECKVTRACVSNWFGGVVPSGGNLLKLADVLAVRQEWLVLYDDGPAQRAALARDVTRKVTYDAAKRVPPVPMLPDQLATDGALMSIYDKLLRLAQDWLALPEKEREQWSKTMQRAARKHRAKSSDVVDDPPRIDLALPKKNGVRPRGKVSAKRRYANKPDES